jgi:hypothetical protein
MPLNRTQIDRVRTLTGHRMLQLSHLKGWDEQVVEDYLAMIDELEARLAVHHDEVTAARHTRQRKRLCNVLGVHPGPDFTAVEGGWDKSGTTSTKRSAPPLTKPT